MHGPTHILRWGYVSESADSVLRINITTELTATFGTEPKNKNEHLVRA
jgi:hypothetical protein